MGANRHWKSGDVFTIPLPDGSAAVGQVVGREAEVLNSVTVALFRRRLESGADALAGDFTIGEAFAVLFVTRDLLDRGEWRVVGTRPIEIEPRFFPYEETREKGWVGARVIGSRIVGRFAAAYFALEPWDQFNDPTYFDKLLLDTDRLPPTRVLKVQDDGLSHS